MVKTCTLMIYSLHKLDVKFSVLNKIEPTKSAVETVKQLDMRQSCLHRLWLFC